jgi:hypothetical protein
VLVFSESKVVLQFGSYDEQEVAADSSAILDDEFQNANSLG